MPKPLLQTPFPPSSVGPFNQSISSIVHQPRNIHRATSSSAVFLNVSYPPSPTQPIPQSNVLVHTIRHLLLPHASIPLLPIIKPTVAPIGFQSPPLDRLSQPGTTACSADTDCIRCGMGATGWHGVRTDRLRLTPVDAFNEQLVFGFRKRLHFIKHLPEQLIYMTLRCFHIPSRGYYQFQLSIAYVSIFGNLLWMVDV